MRYYYLNEMKTEQVIKGLHKLHMHNPDMFHLFYGGEPLLRKDLYEIINHCNERNIHYTIISNNTNEIRPFIKQLLKKVDDQIKGFTASVDPVFHDEKESGEDRVKKSVLGLENLINMKVYVNDVVAEITAMKHNYIYLYDLLKELSKYEINGDVTFIDIAKTPFYDFSNITDVNLLVHQTAQLADQFGKIMKDDSLDVHMKEVLIPAMWDCLPSNMDCEIDQSLHNISIDSDGSIRLCLRIRGVYTPSIVTVDNLITSQGEINTIAEAAIKRDKQEFCEKCNHTCQLMSKHIEQTNSGPEDLVHIKKREVKIHG